MMSEPDEADEQIQSRADANPKRTARLGLRATQRQIDLIWEAAMLEGKTASAFVVEAATTRARDIVADHRDWVVSRQAYDRFFAELDAPAEPVAEMVDLLVQHGRSGDAEAHES